MIRPEFVLGAMVVLGAKPATADVIVACTFPTLPPVVMRYDPVARMEVGGRPAAEMTVGQGTGRFESAEVDGYLFRFAPANSTVDVERDGTKLVSETGQCISIGGPENDVPLTIASQQGAQGTVPDNSPNAVPATSADAPVTGATGDWFVKQDRSAFDDTSTVVLSLQSTDTVRGQFGPPGPPAIYLRCMENTTVAYLWVNDLFLSDIQGFGTVDLRIDDQRADTVRMQGSTDNKSLGLWSGTSAIPFIKRLAEGQRVVFRVTPFNESPVEFGFTVAGLATAMEPLRKACGW